MRYGSSEAYELESLDYELQTWQAPLSPIEGGRMDAHARREVSPALVRAIRYVAALAIVLFMAGGLSVALTSGTVALLQSNAATSSEIKEITAQNGDLRIERSLLTRGDRITLIAEQKLGMVYASNARVIDLD